MKLNLTASQIEAVVAYWACSADSHILFFLPSSSPISLYKICGLKLHVNCLFLYFLTEYGKMLFTLCLLMQTTSGTCVWNSKDLRYVLHVRSTGSLGWTLYRRQQRKPASLFISFPVAEQVVAGAFLSLWVLLFPAFSHLTIHPRSAFQLACRGMMQKIIASINKLKMKQRGVYFIDFLVYSGSFNI